MATSTVEDYLKCILLQQQEEDGLVSTGRVATALNVAPGTVTAMAKTLEKSGLVRYEPYSGLQLTAAGRQLAVHVLRRHRLIELFLVKIMGMDWSAVHGEAERLEHAVSDAIINRMDEMLDHASVDPHGDPIPDARGEVAVPDLVSLLLCPKGTGVRIERITDQTPDFLKFLEREGMGPGVELRVTVRNQAADTIDLALEGGSQVSLGYGAAAKILVAVPVATLAE